MTFDVSARARRGLRIARLCVLVAVSVVVAHAAVYAAHAPHGGELAAAMRARGHDGHWLATVALTAAIAALVAGHAAFRAWRLARQFPDRDATVGRAAAYRSELVALWPLLFVGTTVAFLGLENAEHLAARGHLTGIEPLVGGEHAFSLPILAAITAAIAAAGAFVRWRVAILEAGVAAARLRLARRSPRHSGATRGEWQSASAVAAHKWLLVRSRRGRAPPSTASHLGLPVTA